MFIWNLMKNFFGKLNQLLKSIADSTNILAIQLIFNKQLHPIERVLWMFISKIALFGAYMLILNQYQRFRFNPTVISLDRDYRDWTGVMPAITLCYREKLDTNKADKYIMEQWNITSNDDEYSYFVEFLNAVINSTAFNYMEIAKYAEEERFNEIDLVDMIKKVHRSFDQVVSSFNKKQIVLKTLEMTERGMCYVVNSPIISIISNKSEINYYNMEAPVVCEYGKEQCYIKMEVSDSYGIIEAHSPYEVSSSDTGAGAFELKNSDEVIASFKIMETVAGKNLEALTPSQRKCRFLHELSHDLPIYSKSLCLAKCRADLAIEMCECVPFFYVFIDGERCTPEGFECLSNFKWPIWSYHICNCPNPCNEHVFTIHTLKQSVWGGDAQNDKAKTQASFRWDIIPPKVRMRRDVVFGFEDFLVSFGGAVSLFSGSSFMTIIRVALVAIQQSIYIVLDIFSALKRCCRIQNEKRKMKKFEKTHHQFIM